MMRPKISFYIDAGVFCSQKVELLDLYALSFFQILGLVLQFYEC
jgi:hypothetical protein